MDLRQAAKEYNLVRGRGGENLNNDIEVLRSLLYDAVDAGRKIAIEGLKKCQKTKNGHLLMNVETCSFNHSHYNHGCPVCDGGLAICLICGKAEAELDHECSSEG